MWLSGKDSVVREENKRINVELMIETVESVEIQGISEGRRGSKPQRSKIC